MADSDNGEERILRFLKFRGSQTTESIARHLGITPPGARKHLQSLAKANLVDFSAESGKVGRPRRTWHLTAEAEKRFPDSHSVLTLELIGAVRSIFGEAGLDRLIASREGEAEGRYRSALAGLADPAHKVAKLAELRSEEGYMADWRALPDGTFVLAENHCPICAAARVCQGFCRSELAVFRKALGPDISVTRAEHILEGARRCTYVISPRAGRR